MSTAPAGQYDALAQLVKSGTPVGSSRISAGNAEDPGNDPFAQHDLGGPTDLWGTTWTRDEINANLAVDCWFDLGSGVAGSPFEFDAVGVTVYYTVAGQPRSQTIWMGLGLGLGGGGSAGGAGS